MPCPDRIKCGEREEREKGIVDARMCLHCGTLTYAHHTQIVMQSSFKSQPPSFIDEIQRDLRATAMKADHVIFMGYSLPPDDVTYRAFFSARCQSRPKGRSVHCTIVTKDASNNPDWYAPTTLETRRFAPETDRIVKAAKDIFGNDNVRLYNGGIPEVFLDAGQVTREKVDYLLDWSSSGTT
jgi:hypothetical protein